MSSGDEHDTEHGRPSWPVPTPATADDDQRYAQAPVSRPEGPRMYWGRIEAPLGWSPGVERTTGESVDTSGNGAVAAATGELQPTAPAAAPAPAPVRAGQVLGGIVAGIVAAVVGAIAWGLVTKFTGYEIRGVAVAVGLVAGLGVTIGARARGGALQFVGAVCAAVAILLGKYLAFAFIVKDDLELQFGQSVGLFSSQVSDAFREQIGDVFTLFDALWFALGILAALLVTAGSGGVGTAADGTVRHHHPLDRFTGGLPGTVRVTVDWAVTIIGAVGIVLLVKAFVVNPYRIPSSSMEPTLHCAFGASGCQARFSDRVLANRFIYHFRDPRRGEIIVFETPEAARLRCGAGGTFVKRLIGLPGETIEVKLIKGDGYVFINGKQLDEPYIEPERRQISTAYGPTTIPQDNYFMMGDNREASCDSREWGTVPRGNLVGNVFATYWPPQRISFH